MLGFDDTTARIMFSRLTSRLPVHLSAIIAKFDRASRAATHCYQLRSAILKPTHRIQSSPLLNSNLCPLASRPLICSSVNPSTFIP